MYMLRGSWVFSHDVQHFEYEKTNGKAKNKLIYGYLALIFM